MKDLDKEKFQKVLQKARVGFGLTYYGKSNNLSVSGKWNDKEILPGSLDDEQLVILTQLVGQVHTLLMREQIKRDLVSDEVMELYAADKKTGN